jgi:pimeloyl-ACP methyl ester carboxylesterase
MTANTTNTMIVRSDDADLHVRTAGGNPDGETLVVLHGGPGLSHDYMSGLVELASPDLRIALYDQRGVGRSTGRVDNDLLGSQVRDLAAVQKALGLRRLHLLGHSFGGLVLALFAREHPDAIASAIFVDSAPLTRPELDTALANLMQRLETLTAANLITPGDPSADMTAWVRAALPAYFHDPQHPRAREHGGVTAAPEVYAATQRLVVHYARMPMAEI